MRSSSRGSGPGFWRCPSDLRRGGLGRRPGEDGTRISEAGKDCYNWLARDSLIPSWSRFEATCRESTCLQEERRIEAATRPEEMGTGESSEYPPVGDARPESRAEAPPWGKEELASAQVRRSSTPRVPAGTLAVRLWLHKSLPCRGFFRRQRAHEKWHAACELLVRFEWSDLATLERNWREWDPSIRRLRGRPESSQRSFARTLRAAAIRGRGALESAAGDPCGLPHAKGWLDLDFESASPAPPRAD